MSIYVTGDTHGEMSMSRFSFKKWFGGKSLTKDDYLIIAGDFGLIFYPDQTPAEKYWLKWLSERPWTTLFVDGNHENFDGLNRLPVEVKFGGSVGKVTDSIYHLKRGEIYQIQDKKILTFGGAESIDKLNRIEGISWWKEEVPNHAEMDNCIENMNKHNRKVDIIVAHTCPFFLVPVVMAKSNSLHRVADPTTKMLEHIVTSCSFEQFYCGHWHMDLNMGKYQFTYNSIYKAA